MGDQDHRVALRCQILQQRHHFFAALAVQARGRLVGKDDLSAVHQRARDRHALLLSTGKLTWAMAQTGPQGRATPSSCSARSPGRGVTSRIDRRNFDVLFRVEPAEDCSSETQAEGFAPQPCERIRIQLGNIVAGEVIGAARRRSRQPRIFISVDLPEPEAPMMATNSPG
jgi:hypothetical protein